MLQECREQTQRSSQTLSQAGSALVGHLTTVDLQLYFTLEGEPSRDGPVVNRLQRVLPGSDPGHPDWACDSASAYTLGSASPSLTAPGCETGVSWLQL